MNRGKLLKELRESKRLSQTEAARHIGVSKQTLYKYENNIITNIPSNIIERMATLYETTPAHLMGWQSATASGHELTVELVTLPEYDFDDEAMSIYRDIQSLSPERRHALEEYLRYLKSQS